MSTMTLLEFLNARLDEDTDQARYAASMADGAEWRAEYHEVVRREAGGDRKNRQVAEGTAFGGADVARHIARHDPARVLREVRAKRRLARFALAQAAAVDAEYGCRHGADEIAAGECPDHRPEVDAGLRALAAVYADHPDYREEWAL
ncbi:DUF6221 family protein [Nocardiopsis potens]|uniref:DUF6221 family protein n=1 Tax=Nocardiopsis potens TaxID=1246458 RepID=UPI0003489AE4|nr:DUF6221 family protein [Nocardiopsis potens]